MALANYADLLTSLAGWSNRTDLTSIFPDFVALAEARISRDLRTRRMISNATLTTVANTQGVALPADWLETENLSVLGEPQVTLLVVTPEIMDKRYPAGYLTGKPAVYCVVGNTMELGPTPDSAYSISIDYYAKIPALSTAATNWLMTGHPGVYLSAAMAELCLYLQDDQRITLWDQKYRSEVAALQESDDQAIRSGSSMRVRYI
jgi:hypothetical protein